MVLRSLESTKNYVFPHEAPQQRGHHAFGKAVVKLVLQLSIYVPSLPMQLPLLQPYFE